MTTFVFLGPSLARSEAQAILPDAVYCAPVAMGDLYVVCASQARPGDRVAIIDGYFEQVPAIWHKEILYALSQGIHVWGASSMGALRASEVHTFGMRGIGRIFEAYRDGFIEDDDEVAVAHASAEHGYRPLSDPMATIRFRLDDLSASGALAREAAVALLQHVKRLHYADRVWDEVVDAAQSLHLNDESMAALRAAGDWPDAKAEDARALLRALAAESEPAVPFVAQFTFAQTSYWASLVDSLAVRVEHARAGAAFAADVAAAVDVFCASSAERDGILEEALLDLLLTGVAGEYVPSASDLKESARRLAWLHGLSDGAQLTQWRIKEDISEGQWRRMLERDARKNWALRNFSNRLQPYIASRLQWKGALGPALDAVRRGRAALPAGERFSLDDVGLTYDQLQRWYEQRLGPIDAQPAEHARRLGFPSLRSFLDALVIGYAGGMT